MSQAGITNVTGSSPAIATSYDTDSGTAVPVANILNILGTTTIAGTDPVSTTGSGNTVTTVVQISQAVAGADATKIGLSNYDSGSFAVDADGFVTYIGPTGDVVGPASATDNALSRYDGTTGKLLQNSTVTVTDDGEMTNTSQPAFLAVTTSPDSNATGNDTTFTYGSGNALKIVINFSGKQKIVFRIDIEDKQWFDNALEKIDFVLELLPYHLDPEKIPSDISEIIYRFDSESIRWRLDTALSENKKYTFSGDSWKEII